MPDCSQCNRPLGHLRRRCRRCGACEDCCDCYLEDELPDAFTAAELGLDPEDDTYEPGRWRGSRRN